MKKHNSINATESDKELYGGEKNQGTIPPEIDKDKVEKRSPNYEEENNTSEVDPTKQPPERQMDPPTKTVKTPVAHPNTDTDPKTDTGGNSNTQQQPGNV